VPLPAAQAGPDSPYRTAVAAWSDRDPASVACTPVLRRTSSWMPSCRSNAVIVCDSAGWLTCSFRAAAERGCLPRPRRRTRAFPAIPRVHLTIFGQKHSSWPLSVSQPAMGCLGDRRARAGAGRGCGSPDRCGGMCALTVMRRKTLTHHPPGVIVIGAALVKHPIHWRSKSFPLNVSANIALAALSMANCATRCCFGTACIWSGRVPPGKGCSILPFSGVLNHLMWP
jgi:hypothetical protein